VTSAILPSPMLQNYTSKEVMYLLFGGALADLNYLRLFLALFSLLRRHSFLRGGPRCVRHRRRDCWLIKLWGVKAVLLSTALTRHKIAEHNTQIFRAQLSHPQNCCQNGSNPSFTSTELPRITPRYSAPTFHTHIIAAIIPAFTPHCSIDQQSIFWVRR
jgi:hypothetical protein